MRNVPTLGLLVVLLLHHISKTDADDASSASGLLTELDCGPTLFTNASGVIALPKNPMGIKGTSINCTYIISANRTSEISLNVSAIDSQTIEESFSNCFNESITISCSSGNSSASYCLGGQSVIPLTPVFASCRLVKMSVRSQNYNIQDLVRIPYAVIEENECGNTSFTGPTGVVTSPRFPLSYPPNLRCVYSIEVGRTKTISIDFLSFHLEGTSKTPAYDICIHDWLAISCLSNVTSPVNPPPGRKYCGQKAKRLRLTFSDCSFLILNLVSDTTVGHGGFKLQYTIPIPELDCGATLFTNSSGVISFPSNPTDFLAKVNCSYTISASRLVRISLGASSLELKNFLQSFQFCSKEKLVVSCVSDASAEPKSNISRVFCAYAPYVHFNTLFSSCRTLTFSIFSTHYEYRGLFNIPYTAVAVDEDCGNTSFVGPIGFITSPRFPLSYQHGLNCIYAIEVDRTKTVELHFISFILEGRSASGVCLHDWLTISCLSEGSIATTNSTSSERHCGRKLTIETAMLSNCTAVWLNFVTDASVTSGGFKIQYTIKETGNSTSNITDPAVPDLDCGDTAFTNSSGVFTLPTNPMGYLARVNCDYTISTDRISKISLNVSLLEMRKLIDSFQDCSRGSLEVGCVSDIRQASTLLSFCRGSVSRSYPSLLNLPTFRNCRKLRLSVRSSNYDYQGTFRISFAVVANDEECGNASYTDPSGVITSPKFPLTYAHSLNCIYSIDIGRMNTISLRSISFDLEGTSNTNSTDYCIHDWLTISCSPEGSTEVNPSSSRKYCGLKTTPLKFSFSNCSTLMLNFVTDSSVTRGGFKIKYRVTPPPEFICGVPSYSSPSGVISFPWNYTDYEDSLNCSYVINATEPSSISLTIWSISLQSSDGRNCQSDWLLITCVDGQTELDHKLNHRSCKYLNSSTVLTFPRCASVQLVFHKDSEATGETFRIEYTVNDYVTVKAELPTTSPLTTREIPETRSSCATGCEISSDATYCECITTPSNTIQSDTTTDVPSTARAASVTIQPDTTAVTSDVPITVRTTPDAIQPVTTTVSSEVPIIVRTTSGEEVANTPMSSIAETGYSFVIPIAVIVIVIIAIFLVFLLFRRRFRSQEGQEILLEEMEEDVDHPGLENGNATTGSFVGNSQPA